MEDKRKKSGFLSETEKEYFGIYEEKFSEKEIELYSSEEGEELVRRAQLIYESGVEGFLSLRLPKKSEAKKLPEKTAAQRFFRNETIALSASVKRSKKLAAKYYKNGIKEFDPGSFDLLFRAAESTQTDIDNALKELEEAHRSSDTAREEKAKKELKKSRELLSTIKKQIKKAEKVSKIYRKTAAPYLNAKRLVIKMKQYKEI